MKFFSSSAVIQLAIGIFSLRAAANSGYAATCNSIDFISADSYNSENLISADCRKPDSSYTVGTEININSCFANDNGALVARLNGGFQGSCEDISLSGVTLKASCKNDAGNYVSTSIDTDDYIGNGDGFLYCFNQDGN